MPAYEYSVIDADSGAELGESVTVIVPVDERDAVEIRGLAVVRRLTGEALASLRLGRIRLIGPTRRIALKRAAAPRRLAIQGHAWDPTRQENAVMRGLYRSEERFGSDFERRAGFTKKQFAQAWAGGESS